jgi:hypothetical protein
MKRTPSFDPDVRKVRAVQQAWCQDGAGYASLRQRTKACIRALIEDDQGSEVKTGWRRTFKTLLSTSLSSVDETSVPAMQYTLSRFGAHAHAHTYYLLSLSLSLLRSQHHETLWFYTRTRRARGLYLWGTITPCLATPQEEEEERLITLMALPISSLDSAEVLTDLQHPPKQSLLFTLC